MCNVILILRPKIVIVSAVLIIFSSLLSCSSGPNDEYSAARKFWDKYIVRCGDSYYTALNFSDYTDSSYLVLFQFKRYPEISISSTQKYYSEADKLNGRGQDPYEFLGVSTLKTSGPHRQGVCKNCSPSGTLANTKWEEWEQNSIGEQAHAHVIMVKDREQWSFYLYRGEIVQDRSKQLSPHAFMQLNCSQLLNQ